MYAGEISKISFDLMTRRAAFFEQVATMWADATGSLDGLRRVSHTDMSEELLLWHHHLIARVRIDWSAPEVHLCMEGMRLASMLELWEAFTDG